MKSILKSFHLLFIVIAISLITVRCAIQVPPSGGAIDVTPPKVLKSFPSNYAHSFNKDIIQIFFNEYVQLKDISNQISISPILENEPDFKLKGKSIQIEFFEKLKDSITYTINFGNAIVDYTAGNVLPDYKFVFSTYNTIDTFEIKGNIFDAFTLKPTEKCLVMIYNSNIDSLPLKVKPLYFAKTDKSGYFEINNIRYGKYKIFALLDANSNYLYDLPNESIAFIDSLVFSNIIYKPIKSLLDSTFTKNDSIINKKVSLDTIDLKTDSLQVDSINKSKNFKLYMFQEKDTVQQLIKTSLSDNIKLTFIFKNSLKNLQINPLNVKFDSVWKIEERNQTNDTITYWLLNTKNDSLILQIVGDGKILDTAELKISKQKSISGKGTPMVQKVTFKNNIDPNGFDYFKPLIITAEAPIIWSDLSQIKLMEKKDTTFLDINFSASFIDTIHKTLIINYPWNENKNYSFLLPKGTFKDVHLNYNDSIILNFKTKSYNDYGTIQLNVMLPNSLKKSNYIVQLLNDREKLISEKIINNSQKVKFDFVKPGNYFIKIIYDTNFNDKWDTGNYLKKIQPEKVYYFPKSILIKAGWDITDQEVDLNKY